MELGTFRGESAEFWLSNILTHPRSTLYCVDTFQGGKDHSAAGVDCTENERLTHQRLSRFGVRVCINKMTTDRFFLTSRGPQFDFIYVDAEHTAAQVLRDGVNGFQRLAPGGVMVFDDYGWTYMPRELDRPRMAIDAIIACLEDEIEVLSPVGWQVAIRKKP